MRRGKRSAKQILAAGWLGTAAFVGTAYAQDTDVTSGINYVIRHDRWTEADERGYGEFIASIGNSNCRTVDACLQGPGNPFRASDPDWLRFRSDCADLPYYLRAWYEAEQNLRNQIERTYESRMDHDLAGLRAPGGQGKGVANAPDTDVKAFLASLGARAPTPAGGSINVRTRPR